MIALVKTMCYKKIMKKNIGHIYVISILFSLISIVSGEKLRVASLHPLMGDLAEQIGGENVEVIHLIDAQGNVHNFSPSVTALKKASGARLYLASGKGLESYLTDLRSLLGEGSSVVEVGKKIKSILITKENKHFACCPHDSHGALDPHWWHSLPNIRKAVSIISQEMSKVDPEHKDYYKQNANNLRKKFELLDDWVRKQISVIPKNDRYLVTSHAAFAYFCQEYGFKSIPVQGVNAEQKVSASYLLEANKTIKKNNVKTIFPEKKSNPKELKLIAEVCNAKLGRSLYADSAKSVAELFKHNVTVIVEGLK